MRSISITARDKRTYRRINDFSPLLLVKHSKNHKNIPSPVAVFLIPDESLFFVN